MSGRSSPRRIAAALLVVALGCFVPEATAQLSVRFERYELDSLFRIGCHTAPGWSSLSRDTLLLDFTYHYAAPPIPKLDSDTAWEHQIWRDLYYQNDSVIGGRPPLRTIFRLRTLDALHDRLSVTDNYVQDIGDVQMFTFQATGGTLERVNIAGDPDLLQVRSSSNSGLLVGRPKYVNSYGFRRSDSSRYADTNATPFFDIGNGDRTAAINASYQLRFGFHIAVQQNDSLDSATVLAHVRLWRRIPVNDTCRCRIYQALDSIPLTYGMYLDAVKLPFPLDQFRDVGFWIDMRDSSEFGVIADNVKYKARPGGWAGWPATDSLSRVRCRDTFAVLRASGRIHPSSDTLPTVEESDIFYDFVTHGAARISFLRGRVAPH